MDLPVRQKKSGHNELWSKKTDAPDSHFIPRVLRFAIIGLLLTLPLIGCQQGVGIIFAIAIHPNRPQVLYIASQKGLYKTIDDGTTWNRIEEGLGDFQILSISINPQIPSILYVGTFSDGVYRSTDGGRNWMLINAGMRDYVSVVNTVAINPKSPHIVYAGTTMGAYKSIDNGGMWERIVTGLNSVFVVCIAVDPTNPTLVYAGTSGGIYKSVDGGQRWITSNSGMIGKEHESALALGVNAIAFDPDTSGRLFAATAQGLYESRDDGGQWSLHNIPEPFVLSVAVRSGTPTFIYAGTNRGLYVSRDDGALWEKINKQEIRTIAIDPFRPERAFFGNGNGLFRTDDGGKGWRRIEILK